MSHQQSLLLTNFHGFYAEMKAGSQQAKQAQAFATQLQSIFQTQFSQQQDIFKALTTQLMPVLQTGWTPAAQAATQTAALQGTATQFQNAQRALNQQLAERGSAASTLPSGTVANLLAGIDTAQATAQSNNLLNIAMQGQQNQFTAANLLAGPVGSYGNSLPSSAGAFLNANQQAFTEAKQSSWGNFFGGLLNSAVQGAAGALTGGLAGNIFGGGGSSIAQTPQQVSNVWASGAMTNPLAGNFPAGWQLPANMTPPSLGGVA